MPSRSELFQNVGTGLLITCALVITALVVRNEIRLRRVGRAPEVPSPRAITNWPEVAASGNVRGRPDAPVKIVEFADYQCPFCATFEHTLAELRRRHPDKVATIFRHFPLQSIHPHAFTAAVAALCAGEQGRFDAYHDALYEGIDSIGARPWRAYARDAGVPDVAALDGCIETRRYGDVVVADMKVGRALGLSATPTLVINGTMITGGLDLAQLEEWIEKSPPDSIKTMDITGQLAGRRIVTRTSERPK